MYDYLLVGAGLFNAVFAHEAVNRGKKCLVLEQRANIGGNCYTYVQDGIVVHKYGAHIFRTSDKAIWEYMQNFATFNHFVNSPVAVYRDELYNLPFNMNTFSKMWGIWTPEEAERIIAQQRKEINHTPTNLEEHAICLVGRDIYEKLIKGYTEKQWGRSCRDLPASIMRRIPVRYTYDNNYFNDPYQGIPVGGYTPIIEKMFNHCEIKLNTNYLANKEAWNSQAKKIIYTGPIDAYYSYNLGELEYRSLRFETESLPMENYQGVAVVNYTDIDIPYTRTIEHKHFEFGTQKNTVISREYPAKWEKGIEPYYPINDEKNDAKYLEYLNLATKDDNVIFAGRLGSYKYTDMQETIKNAMELANRIL